MEIPQLTFNKFPAAAFPGQLADLSTRDVETGVLDVAADCGRALVTGGGFGRVKLPTSAGDITGHFRGFVLYTAIKDPRGAVGANLAARFAATDSVNVLRKGRIWIMAEGDVIQDADVYVVHTDADPTKVGLIRADANTNKAALAPRCKVYKGATAGNLAIVEVNLV